MATYTDAQIREAIETVLNAKTTNAVVFPWWALSHRPEHWPGQLVSSAESDRVHGYVVTRSLTDGERKNPQCVTRSFNYDIWGFHFYETGTRTANTDFAFNAELDAISDAFIIASSLPPALARAEPPSFRVDLNVFGGEMLHYAIGRLVVEQL